MSNKDKDTQGTASAEKKLRAGSAGPPKVSDLAWPDHLVYVSAMTLWKAWLHPSVTAFHLSY